MKISAQKTYASLADVDVASLNEEEREQYENALRIQELRAQEKFITTATGKMTCVNCGWTYDSTSGDGKKVPPGVSFEDLEEKWRCPVCYSPKSGFRLEMRTIAGFETNQSYGLGTNSLTEDQKNLLIFGGLFLGFLFLRSGYLLD
jgi:rubredoxin